MFYVSFFLHAVLCLESGGGNLPVTLFTLHSIKYCGNSGNAYTAIREENTLTILLTLNLLENILQGIK